ncbi:FAD-dependent thymidylate synthase [Streptomyces sp. NPDC006798]|uniref:FAD-dependent thymidylate synthase n=1 Tax=Streptomyces sp. NPDC006798 TaxID=3155462 RepID=UPI00340023AB
MSTIRFRSDMGVELIDAMGGDHSIVRAARVSSGSTAGDPVKDKGLVNFLARDRHGSPFEATVLQFKITVPVFVAREWFRHRVGSFNEVSGRYTILEPVFYQPTVNRPLKQVGTPGAYRFEPGTVTQTRHARVVHRQVAETAWTAYEDQLALGVAREVARNVLPLSLYTSFYWTVNARSLMNFLSLRRVTDSTTVPTFPLYEIDQAAGLVEELAREVAPEAFAAFDKHGRVAP